MNYKKIIPFLIAVLGFTTACEKEDSKEDSKENSNANDSLGIAPLYGAMAAEYQQKSNVPIENTTGFIQQKEEILDEQ